MPCTTTDVWILTGLLGLLPVCVLCDKCCNLGQGFLKKFDTCHAMGGQQQQQQHHPERVGGVFDLSDLLKNLLRNQTVTAAIATISRAQRERERNKTVRTDSKLSSHLFSLRSENCLARVQKFHKLLQIVVVACHFPFDSRETRVELELELEL